TACPDWCSYPEINDIALIATRRAASPNRSVAAALRHPLGVLGTAFRGGPPTQPNPDPSLTHHAPDEIGFSVRVAGGLSTQPHLAVPLNAFIRWDQAIPVVRAITELFRQSDVLRQSRDKARLKYLFLEHGWTADSFLAALQSRLGYSLDPAEPNQPPPKFTVIIWASFPKSDPANSPLGLPLSAAASLPRNSLSPRISPNVMAMVTSATHQCRISSSSTFRRLMSLPSQTNSPAPGSRSNLPPSLAAPSPARVPNFASSLSPKPSPMPGGSPSNLKIVSPTIRNSFASTSPAAPTPAVSIGSPTSALKAKKSNRMAK